MSKSTGRPPLKGSANDLPAHVGTCPILGVGREEQKEEEVLPAASVSRSHDRVAERGPYVKVNHPSSLTSSSSVHFSSLKPGIPMCGPTPVPRERSCLNPAAGGFIPRTPGGFNQGLFVPRPPGWFEQGLAWWQLLPQQMSLPLQAWPQQLGCLGVEPWLCTPCVGPALGYGRVLPWPLWWGRFRGPAQGLLTPTRRSCPRPWAKTSPRHYYFKWTPKVKIFILLDVKMWALSPKRRLM